MLSQHPWRKDNSFGNSYSSIFGKIDGIEIAHIYLLDGMPDYEENVKRYYLIKEGDVLKSFFTRRKGTGVGKEIFLSKKNEDNEIIACKTKKTCYQKMFSFGRKHHWISLFWARELMWRFGNINYEGLMNFVYDFNPDIIFLPYGYVYNTNRIALYIKKLIKIPMVMYMAMDHYSMKRVSFNPLFWIDRVMKRRNIMQLVKESELLYVISEKLKKELEVSLPIKCKVLYKYPDSQRMTIGINKTDYPIHFLFTGNIFANRWKSLSILVKELKNNKLGCLDVYTASPISNSMKKALDVEGVSKLHNPVSQNEIIRLQSEADVLVHAEAFDLFNKLLVRCAISTKIMDYLSSGKCILAIGPHNIASMEYLQDNNLAVTANSVSELSEKVNTLLNNPQLIREYAERTSEFVRKNLNPVELRKSLYNDLKHIIDNYKNNE